MNTDVEFPVDPNHSLITGRNGTYNIRSIDLHGGESDTFIDGISAQRRLTINGGFYVDTPSLEAGLILWLRKRGYIIIGLDEIGFNVCIIDEDLAANNVPLDINKEHLAEKMAAIFEEDFFAKVLAQAYEELSEE